MNERYAAREGDTDRGLLQLIEQAVAWWGAHRAWPANEPARLPERLPPRPIGCG